MDSLEKLKVGIVANDRGGAELLASYSMIHKGSQIFCLEGLALELFTERCGVVESKSLTEVVEGVDWVLTGTGWQSHLESDAITLAKSQGKFVVAFVDSVTNFRQRFEVEGKLSLPDEIWFLDTVALEVGSREFPQVTVRLMEVPFRAKFQARVRALELAAGPPDSESLLYVSDNTEGVRRAGHVAASLPSDETCFKAFLRHADKLPQFRFPVTIRKHPTESADTWAWAQDLVGEQIIFSENSELEEDVASHATVVGRKSGALLLAALCKRDVFTLSADFLAQLGPESHGLRLLG